MADKRSAGILLFREAPGPGQGLTHGPAHVLTSGQDGGPERGRDLTRDLTRGQERDARPGIEVLLGHMGGPFWARRDAGAWSVVKGEYGPDEPAREAARREFREELGLPVPGGEWLPLGEVRQSGGKLVTVWAVEADLDPGLVVPGTFTMEWPRGSGRLREFPEIDRAAWLEVARAREKIVAAQRVFLDRLAELRG